MTVPAEPPRSLAERALRWLSGADRKEAEAQAQAEQAAAFARAEAEAQAQAERDRLAVEARAEAQAAQAAREAQAASVHAAASSTEPLLRVQTPTGGSYFIRTADWLAARAARARDVAICDWQGQPVREGQRSTLRLSTIEAATLQPTAIIRAADYLDPETASQDGLSMSL